MRIILYIVLLPAMLVGASFEQFLDEALKRSPYLHSSKLKAQSASLKSEQLRLYKNPELDVELSQFEPDVGRGELGYGVLIRQPVRLWGVSDGIKRFGDSMIKGAKIDTQMDRAEFIQKISELYVAYVKSKMLLDLGTQELHIAKKILQISEARYTSGTIPRSSFLQAKVAYEMVKIKIIDLELRQTKTNFQLLSFAGIDEEILVDDKHIFRRLDGSSNLKLKRLEASQESALAKANMSSNKIKWINLGFGYEREIEQDIMRLSLDLPLPLFDTKQQSVELAKLEAKQASLLHKSLQDRLLKEERYLLQEASLLERSLRANEKIRQDEQELLEMFSRGYKLASLNLLELQDVKNRLLKTEEQIINIKTAKSLNTINLNYIKGAYNE